MMKKKILIIDDDLEVCKEIKYALQNETTDAYYATSASDAFEKLTTLPFCLVIMDTRLSETDGISLLRTIRYLKTIPVLVLSSKIASADKVAALRAGASSYMNKPYELEECLEQAQSLIALFMELHGTKSRCYTLAFGMDLVIDPARRQVLLKGELLNLTRTEFELLLCLATHAGQVLSREQLYNQVWSGESDFSIDDAVKNHIKKLRKKLTPANQEYIKNVWGVGYRFTPDEPQKI